MADDILAALLAQELAAQQKPRPGRVPMSGAFTPEGEQIYRPEAEPTEPSMLNPHLRMALENPGRAALGTLQGLLMTSGMSGGPSGAFTSVAKQAGQSPLAQQLATALGLSTAGAAALTPSQAGPPGDVPAGESIAPNADNLQRLLTQRQSLDRQRSLAVEERDAQLKGASGRKAGRGPVYEEKDREVRRLTDEMGALDKIIADEQKRGSPEFALEMKQREAQAAEDARIKRASTPTRELLSDYTAYIPAVTGAAALAGGAAIKGRSVGNLQKELADISNRWGQAVNRAHTSASGPAYQTARKEAQGLGQEFSAVKDAGEKGTRHALEFGAGTGVVGAFLPEEIDFARAVAGSPLWGKLKETLIDDWPSSVKRAAIAGALGGGISHLGSLGAGAAMTRPTPSGYGPATDALPPRRLPPASGAISAPPPGVPGSPPDIASVLAAPAPAPQATPSLPEMLSAKPAGPKQAKRQAEREWQKATSGHHSEKQPRDKSGKFNGPPEQD